MHSRWLQRVKRRLSRRKKNWATFAQGQTYSPDRDRLSVKRLGGMTDATAGVHRGARRGSLAARSASAGAGEGFSAGLDRGRTRPAKICPTASCRGSANSVTPRSAISGSRNELPALAPGLARLPLDVIVTSCEAPIRAAMQASGKIPIVMTLAPDLVRSGLIPSLARCRGRVRGMR
jgi:hypothetical protein